MGAKKMANMFRKIIKAGGDALKTDEELQEEVLEGRSDIMRFCKIAKVAVLANIEEEEFVKCMSMVQKTVVAEAVISGDVSVMMADLEGALQSYTQTVILATIGALIEDDIL